MRRERLAHTVRPGRDQAGGAAPHRDRRLLPGRRRRGDHRVRRRGRRGHRRRRRPSPGEAGALRGALGKGVTVVAAARTGGGAVYDAHAPGVLPAEDLLPQKARILLLLTLATTREPADVAERFARYGVPQFTLTRSGTPDPLPHPGTPALPAHPKETLS
ncbi:hypothetical protein ACFQ3Z_29805 [Streptomyces nogalater]